MRITGTLTKNRNKFLFNGEFIKSLTKTLKNTLQKINLKNQSVKRIGKRKINCSFTVRLLECLTFMKKNRKKDI